MSYQDFQQQPYNPYGPPPQQTSGAATAALILGICGFVVCPLICSIAAIFVARSAYKEIDSSGGRIGGRSMAQAGLILGWIGVGLCLLSIVAFVLFIVLAIGSSTMIETEGEFSAIYMALQP